MPYSNRKNGRSIKHNSGTGFRTVSYTHLGGSEQESISIKYVLKNGKTISRKYDGYYIARNTKDIMKKMSDITSTKYYSQVKHPFYIIPYKYITDMQISKYVVNGDANEEETYSDDYAVKAGQVTDEVDYCLLYTSWKYV